MQFYKWFGIGIAVWLGLMVWAVRSDAKAREKARIYRPMNNGPGAAFAADAEIEAGGGFKKGEHTIGFTLGTNREICYNPTEDQLKPTIIFGSMGSGKTTCAHIPQALRWGLDGRRAGSILILDTT